MRMAKKNVTEELTHSPLFEKYRTRYEKGGCTKDQLRRLVALGVLTGEEFFEITGEDYE